MSPPRVAVIGAGGVGTTLGKRLNLTGHTVTFGSRVPGKKIENFPGEPLSLSYDEAISSADVVILATPGPTDDAAIEAFAKSLPASIKGKIVIDATNPLSKYPGLQVRWAAGTSSGEVLQENLKDSFVYKAFNTIGRELMENPSINGQPLTMLFAGPSEHVKIAFDIVAGVGFIPKYVGPIYYARHLEAIAELWIHIGVPGVGQFTHTLNPETGPQSAKWGRDFHFQVIDGADKP